MSHQRQLSISFTQDLEEFSQCSESASVGSHTANEGIGGQINYKYDVGPQLGHEATKGNDLELGGLPQPNDQPKKQRRNIGERDTADESEESENEMKSPPLVHIHSDEFPPVSPHKSHGSGNWSGQIEMRNYSSNRRAASPTPRGQNLSHATLRLEFGNGGTLEEVGKQLVEEFLTYCEQKGIVEYPDQLNAIEKYADQNRLKKTEKDDIKEFLEQQSSTEDFLQFCEQRGYQIDKAAISDYAKHFKLTDEQERNLKKCLKPLIHLKGFREHCQEEKWEFVQENVDKYIEEKVDAEKKQDCQKYLTEHFEKDDLKLAQKFIKDKDNIFNKSFTKFCQAQRLTDNRSEKLAKIVADELWSSFNEGTKQNNVEKYQRETEDDDPVVTRLQEKLHKSENFLQINIHPLCDHTMHRKDKDPPTYSGDPSVLPVNVKINISHDNIGKNVFDLWSETVEQIKQN